MSFRGTISYLLIILLLFSCGSETVYREFNKDFPGNRWDNDILKDFSFTIEESGHYNLAIDFSHVYGTPFIKIPLQVSVLHPSGEKQVVDTTLNLIGNGQKVLSDCAGDYCDLRQDILSSQHFAVGNYKVFIENRFKHEYLPNVMGIGIRLIKSETVQ